MRQHIVKIEPGKSDQSCLNAATHHFSLQIWASYSISDPNFPQMQKMKGKSFSQEYDKDCMRLGMWNVYHENV